MGFYLQCPEATGKALQLKRDHNAQYILPPKNFSEIPAGKTLVCVVENGRAFDAAGIVIDQRELEEFSETESGRPRTWLLLDTEEVVKIASHLTEHLRGEKPWRY